MPILRIGRRPGGNVGPPIVVSQPLFVVTNKQITQVLVEVAQTPATLERRTSQLIVEAAQTPTTLERRVSQLIVEVAYTRPSEIIHAPKGSPPPKRGVKPGGAIGPPMLISQSLDYGVAPVAYTATHTSGQIVLAGGAHSELVGRAETAGNIAITGGTHNRTVARLLASGAVVLTGGVSTALHGYSVTHSAGSIVLSGGADNKSVGRGASAGQIVLTGGTHTKARTATHTAGVVTLTGGTDNRTVSRIHASGQVVIAGGVHSPLVTTPSRPDGDISIGGWTTHLGATTGLWDEIDEAIPDNADYIQSSLSPAADVVTMSMTNVSDPGIDTGHTLRYRYGKASTDTQIDLLVRLLQGVTVIHEWTHTDIPIGPVTAEQLISDTDIANITNYSDIRLEFEASEV